MKLKEIITFLEELAPPSLQENYDNSGLLVGNMDMDVSKALVSLDTTEDILQEAIDKGANLVISHHPIIFSGLKRLTGKNHVERTVIKAIQHNIAIYAIHTNLDHVENGVNKKISDKIGLKNCTILAPKEGMLNKLITYVPIDSKEDVLNALFNAGAGNIGKYAEASFSHKGFGTFNPKEGANPVIGSIGNRETVEEYRVEVLVPDYKLSKVLPTLFKAHPYEEVAYDIISLNNTTHTVGTGMIGELEESMEINEFLTLLKKTFNIPAIRHTQPHTQKIKRVALCGGAGSFVLKDAIVQGADIFITGDFKYHEFFDADNQIIIADIGHYESEQFTSELLTDYLNKKFRNFTVFKTDLSTNPVKYFI